MDASFDPYESWLNIPKQSQPPDPYVLLGLNQGESDVEAIRLGFERQYGLVRKYHLGAYAEPAQRLLEELSRAYQTLSTEQQRAGRARAPESTSYAPPPALVSHDAATTEPGDHSQGVIQSNTAEELRNTNAVSSAYPVRRLDVAAEAPDDHALSTALITIIAVGSGWASLLGILLPAASGYLVALAVVFGVWRLLNVLYSPVYRLQQACGRDWWAARRRWKAARQALRKAASRHRQRLEQTERALQNLLHRQSTIRDKEASVIRQLTDEPRAQQLEAFLKSHEISVALRAIPQVGPQRLQMLASVGIRTAHDITRGRLAAIPGFNRVAARSLLAWRARVESQFAFLPPPTLQEELQNTRRAFHDEEQALKVQLQTHLEQMRADRVDARRELDELRPVVETAQQARRLAWQELKRHLRGECLIAAECFLVPAIAITLVRRE